MKRPTLRPDEAAAIACATCMGAGLTGIILGNSQYLALLIAALILAGLVMALQG